MKNLRKRKGGEIIHPTKKFLFLLVLCLFSFVFVEHSEKSFSFPLPANSNSGTEGDIIVVINTTTVTKDGEGKISRKEISNDNYSCKLLINDFYASLKKYKANENVCKKMFAPGEMLPTVLTADNDIHTYDAQGNETTYDGKPVQRKDVVFSSNIEVYTPDPCSKSDEPALIETGKGGGSGAFHKASVAVKLYRENNPGDGFRISVMTGGLPFQLGGDKIQGATSSEYKATENDQGDMICKWFTNEPGFFQQPAIAKILDNSSNAVSGNFQKTGKRSYSLIEPDAKKDFQFCGIDTATYFNYLQIHPPSTSFNMVGKYHSFDNTGGSIEVTENVTVILTIGLVEKKIELSGKDDGEYHNWLPMGINDADRKPIDLKAKINTTDQIKEDTLYFSLDDVSNFYGECSNYPLFNPNGKAGQGMESDIVFSKSQHDPTVIYIDSFHVKTIKRVTEAYVTVESRDYAGQAKLHVKNASGIVGVSKYDSENYLTIPEDKNKNDIADAWELKTGIYSDNHAATWDDDAYPENQKMSGDGITLFEEYRGFETVEDISENGKLLMRSGNHVRLDPNYKDVFVLDETGLFKKYYEAHNAAKLNWHLLDKTMMNLEKSVADQLTTFNIQLNNARPDLNKYFGSTRNDSILNIFFNKTIAGAFAIANIANQTKNRIVNYNTDNKYKIMDVKGLHMIIISGLPYDFGGAACFPTEDPTQFSIKNCAFIVFPIMDNYRLFMKGMFSKSPTYGIEPAFSTMISNQIENNIIHEIGHSLGIHHHIDTSGNENPGKYYGVTNCAMRYFNKADLDSGFLLNHMDIYCTTGDNCFGQINIKCQ